MARKKTIQDEEVKIPTPTSETEEIENPEAEAAAAPEAKADVNDAYAIVNGEIFVREYSLKVHGPDYKKLAEQLVVQKPSGRGAYSIIPSSQIDKVEVRYREKEDAELHIDRQNPDAPIVDKIKVFDDKNAALAFAVTHGGLLSPATVVISKRKKK